MYNFAYITWLYIFLKFTIFICFFPVNCNANVSVLLILFGRMLTIGSISTSTLTVFPQTSFCPPLGKSQICIKSILCATGLSSIGYSVSLDDYSVNPILSYNENFGTLPSYIVAQHVLCIYCLLSFAMTSTVHFATYLSHHLLSYECCQHETLNT